MALNGFGQRWGASQWVVGDLTYAIPGAERNSILNNTYVAEHNGSYFAYSIYATSNLDPSPAVPPMGSPEIFYYYVNGPRPGEIIKVAYVDRSGDIKLIETHPVILVPH